MKKVIYILITILLFLLIFSKINNKEEPNSITFATWGSQSEMEIVNKVIDKFEQDNNIKVKLMHIPQNYFQKIHMLFATNMAPDVIFINNHNIQLYTKAGLLEDLTPFFSKVKNEYFEEAINCFKNDNKIYAIPRDISSLVLYYNKDILKKQNITLPKKIKTIFQLKEIAERVTTNEIWGINYEEDPLYWIYYLASNGGGIISDDKNSIIINKKESLEALNLYSDFINEYHIAPNKSDIGSMTTAQMFINGKLTMYLGGRWMFPKFEETIDFDWDVIAFPSNEKNKLYIDSSGWAISKNSKNKENAVKFINYISSTETQEAFVNSGLIVPARKSAINTFLKNSNKNQTFIEMIRNTKPTPTNENYGKINDVLKEKSQTIFYNNQKAEDIFDEKTIEKLEKLL